MTEKVNLKSILENKDSDSKLIQSAFDYGSDSEQDMEAPEGFCVECKDQEIKMYCKGCDESYCDVCFSIIHRSGKRKLHEFIPKNTPEIKEPNKVSVEISGADSVDPEPQNNAFDAENVSFSKMSDMLNDAVGSNFGEWITER
ncbi:hypothetical protein AYI68_g3063 [Smittium mucronatum]|uniref:B box-type domain-containing protein n=1 Tax=Smittium mucronatum TaxID=133383 RepID=A0A1R0H0W7_9FUNG|nr:hypothetical protein AYI68_g3063 [Smittium mucronatum]